MTRYLRRTMVALWLPTVLVIFWQFATVLADHPFFPPPSALVAELLRLATWDFLNDRVLPTMTLVLGGYFVGAVLGVVQGVIIASWNGFYRSFGPIAVFVRSIPSAAIIPVILALFGIGNLALYAVVVVAVAFQVTLVTMTAVSHTDQVLLDSARVLGLPPLKVLFQVRIPAATGKILSGLYLAVQVALVVAVAAETIAAGGGLGRFISEALDVVRIAHMWVAVVILGIMGAAFHFFFGLLEARLFPWYRGMRKEEAT